MKLNDKVLHATVSAVLTIALSFVLPVWAAALATLAVGGLKEVWDRYHGGVPSWTDILADLCGIVFGAAVALLLFFSRI